MNDSDGDGVCDELEIYGCTNGLACNYVVEGHVYDGSCLCTMMSWGSVVAIVFQMPMTMAFVTMWTLCWRIRLLWHLQWRRPCLRVRMHDIPAGDCDCEGNELDALGVCGGNCSSDEDADGVCDDAEILGCTFAWGCNYEPMATEDDGSCSEICEGCTDAFACNYDSSANADDGSCVYSDPGFDCAGNCWDLDEDGQCDDPWNNLVEGPVVVELDTAFTQGELAGYRSFLVYLEMDNATDVLSAIWSDTIFYDWTERLQINAPLGCWNPSMKALSWIKTTTVFCGDLMNLNCESSTHFGPLAC